jgi:hypothetical protein
VLKPRGSEGIALSSKEVGFAVAVVELAEEVDEHAERPNAKRAIAT